MNDVIGLQVNSCVCVCVYAVGMHNTNGYDTYYNMCKEINCNYVE